jgi:hypothetical protein
MNESEASSAPSEIQDQIAALRRQVFTLLLALIVVSGTLTVYLYRQATITRRDLTGIRPQATQMISAFNQSRTNIQAFVQELSAFGRTHPDFQPILKKYGINPAAAPAPAKK